MRCLIYSGALWLPWLVALVSCPSDSSRSPPRAAATSRSSGPLGSRKKWRKGWPTLTLRHVIQHISDQQKADVCCDLSRPTFNVSITANVLSYSKESLMFELSDAALFRHSPALSAFQVQLTLPCDEDEWDAPNAVEWARIHARSRPPIPFISALKASLMAGAAPPGETFIPLCRSRRGTEPRGSIERFLADYDPSRTHQCRTRPSGGFVFFLALRFYMLKVAPRGETMSSACRNRRPGQSTGEICAPAL